MASLTESEKWRRQAHDALARLSKAMNFFLNASAQLIRLSQVHEPNEFSHCTCCNTPWPCETASIVKSIGQAWETLRSEEEKENGKR
jgi:hypothetical protein